MNTIILYHMDTFFAVNVAATHAGMGALLSSLYERLQRERERGE
jgi:hypothetical protein